MGQMSAEEAPMTRPKILANGRYQGGGARRPTAPGDEPVG